MGAREVDLRAEARSENGDGDRGTVAIRRGRCRKARARSAQGPRAKRARHGMVRGSTRWCEVVRVGGVPTGGAGRPAKGGWAVATAVVGDCAWVVVVLGGFQIMSFHRSPATQQPPRAGDHGDHGPELHCWVAGRAEPRPRRADCWVDRPAVGYARRPVGYRDRLLGPVAAPTRAIRW